MSKDFTLSKLFSKSTLKAPIVISDDASNKLTMNIKKHLSHHINPVCLGSCTMANSRVEHQNNTHNSGFGFTMRTRDIQAGLYLITNFKTKNITSGSLLKKRYNYSKCNLACREEGPSTHSTKCTNIDFELENGNLTTYKKNTGMCEDEFHLADVDKDGLLTQDEYHGTLETFDAADKNKDGKLTLQEATNQELVPLLCTEVKSMGDECKGLGDSSGCFLKDSSYCCTDYGVSGCLDSNKVCGTYGTSTPDICLSGNMFRGCNTKYRGVNLSAYDGGSLAGGQADTTKTGQGICVDASKNPSPCGLCTDAIGNTGGYSIAHNSTANTPDTSNAMSSRSTTGGNLVKWGHYDASSSPLGPLNPIVLYATVYTLTSQIDYAVDAGVNIFRIPFMPTFIDKLTTGWASKVIVDPSGGKRRAYIYLPPNPEYINFYMTTVNYIIETYGDKDIKIIIDSHVYQRWCPMNIPGTSSCLAADVDSTVAPPRKYSMNKTADNMCPYKVVEATNGVNAELDALLKPINHDSWADVAGNDPKPTNITANNIGSWLDLSSGEARATDGHYCKSAIDISNTSVTPFSDLSGNLKTNPPGCIEDTSGGNNCYGPPTKRILGPDCTVTMWYNILNTEYKLLDKVGNYRTGDSGKGWPVSGTLKTYFADERVRPHIFIGLMNEPNEVNTDDLGKTYGMLFVLFRKMFDKPLTLLVEGNSWAGLHAQCDPITGGLNDTSGVRIQKLTNYANGASVAEAWRTGEMSTIKYALDIGNGLNFFNLNPKNENDYENYPCEIIRKAIETEMSGNGLDYYSDSEKNPWMYDVHQYMDKNSTGGNACVQQDQTKTAKPTYTIEDMEKFTNFIPFMKWARHYNIKVIATEFGAQIQGDDAEPWGCNNRLNLFIKMLEQKEYDDIIVGWTLWRAPPSISWLVSKGSPVGLWTNSIIFGPGDNPWPQDSSAVFHEMYTVVKPFTDASFGAFGDISEVYKTAENEKHFCMPELWSLEGGAWSAKSTSFWDKYVNVNWKPPL